MTREELEERLRRVEADQAALRSLIASAFEYAGLPVEAEPAPAPPRLAVVR